MSEQRPIFTMQEQVEFEEQIRTQLLDERQVIAKSEIEDKDTKLKVNGYALNMHESILASLLFLRSLEVDNEPMSENGEELGLQEPSLIVNAQGQPVKFDQSTTES